MRNELERMLDDGIPFSKAKQVLKGRRDDSRKRDEKRYKTRIKKQKRGKR